MYLQDTQVTDITQSFDGTQAIADTCATLPKEQVQGAVHFISDGVGMNGPAAMERALKDYPLALRMTAKDWTSSGHYPETAVRIRDGHGRVVLNTVVAGPYLLVNISPGKYKIAAKRCSKLKTLTVKVGAKCGNCVLIEWDDA